MCGRVACTLAPQHLLEQTGAKRWENKNCLKSLSEMKKEVKKEVKQEVKEEVGVKQEVKHEDFSQDAKEFVKKEVKQEGVKQEVPQQNLSITEYKYPSYNNGPCVFLPCLVPEGATSKKEGPKREPIIGEIDEGDVVISVMRWGLIPKYARDTKLRDSKTINARDDRLASSPLWKPLFNSNRCAVVIQGYFEWQTKQSARKQPHYFHCPGDQPLVLAGLWECWKNGPGKYNDPFEELYSCTIVTRAATKGVCGDIHERMPVILQDEKDLRAWLYHGKLDMLKSQETPKNLGVHKVDFGVGNMKNNSADLIIPLSEYQKKKGGIASFFNKASPKKITPEEDREEEKNRDEVQGNGKRKAENEISNFISAPQPKRERIEEPQQ